jgi:hypothetical protein
MNADRKDVEEPPIPLPVLGACCNRQTGECSLTTKEDCVSPLEWLGAASTCGQCTKTPTAGTDFGNAPDPPYATLIASNGARHTIVPGVFLGSAVGVDDGVVFTSALRPGHEASVEVVASTQGYLNAWLDFARNGRFNDRTEMIFTDQIAGPRRQPAYLPGSVGCRRRLDVCPVPIQLPRAVDELRARRRR